MPPRPDLASARLTRRGLLCGAGAVALAGCTSTATLGELGDVCTRISEAEVQAYLARVTAAFQAGDWEALKPLLGPESDQAAWLRVMEGMLAVPMSERVIDLSPNNVNHAEMRGTGPLRTKVMARVRHRIADVDAVSIVQVCAAVFARQGPGQPLQMQSLAFGAGIPQQPWQLARIKAVAGERVVLQYRVEDEAVARSVLPTLDAGAARAYASVPRHSALAKQSMLWGWGDAVSTPDLYGGRVLSEAVGVTYRVPAEGGLDSTRVLMRAQEDPAELEFTACHETVHALAATWGQSPSYTHLVEGLATWVEYSFLAGLRRYNVSSVKPFLDDAVATHFWRGGFYAGESIGARYAISALYLAWLEEQLGRDATLDLVKACYGGHGTDDPIAKALGAEHAVLDARFAEWARAF